MEKKENKIEYKREIIKSNIEPSIAFELIKMIEKAQEYDKLTTMDKKLMQMSEDGKGFQVVRNAKGEPFQVIKQEEYMRLVDIENKYDSLVSGEVMKDIEEVGKEILFKDSNMTVTVNSLLSFSNIKNHILAQAKELEELKKKQIAFSQANDEYVYIQGHGDYRKTDVFANKIEIRIKPKELIDSE